MGGLPSVASIFNNELAGVGAASAQSATWRPPQWQQPALVSITVPPQTQVLPGASGSGMLYQTTVTAQTTYVFDAVLSLEHEQRLEKTRHPVQTGADLSSHAYLQPAHVVLYVGMSDAMQSYATGMDPTQPPYVQPWTGAPSKSVSTYQQMISLQASRQPLTLTTRLQTYTNMLITSVTPQEDYRTLTGLRMRVEMEQVFTAAIATAPVSARPQDTQQTNLGGLTTQAPSNATLRQFALPSSSAPVNTPGAGSFTSILGTFLGGQFLPGTP